MATVPTLANYNANPWAQSGAGTYGAVPGAIGIPPSIYSQVGAAMPNLSGLTSQAGNVIGSEMSGQVPTDVMQQIQNAGATWGMQTGMPGSGLANDFSLENLGLTSLQEQQAGLGNYLKTLTGVGSTMQSPQLMAEIAARNATMAAAPNPGAAAQHLENLAGGGASNPFTRVSTNGGINTGVSYPGLPGFGSQAGGWTNPLTGQLVPSTPFNPTGYDPSMQWSGSGPVTGGTMSSMAGSSPDYYNVLASMGIDPTAFMSDPASTSTGGYDASSTYDPSAAGYYGGGDTGGDSGGD